MRVAARRGLFLGLNVFFCLTLCFFGFDDLVLDIVHFSDLFFCFRIWDLGLGFGFWDRR